MNKPIRLTNKTAIALRKSAQKVRTMHNAAAVLLSVAMAAFAVYFGIKWLPAVPLTVVVCVLLDCAIVTRGRSEYLLLIGQAICTEAAAREIRQEGREKKRKERAVSDLMEAKADIQKDVRKPAERKVPEAQPFFEKGMSEALNQAMLEGKTVVLPASHTKGNAADVRNDGTRRRRQQKSLQIIRNQAK